MGADRRRGARRRSIGRSGGRSPRRTESEPGPADIAGGRRFDRRRHRSILRPDRPEGRTIRPHGLVIGRVRGGLRIAPARAPGVRWSENRFEGSDGANDAIPVRLRGGVGGAARGAGRRRSPEPVRRGIVILSDGDRIEARSISRRSASSPSGPGSGSRSTPRAWRGSGPRSSRRRPRRRGSSSRRVAEKIKLPEWYPIRKYESDIVLRDGTRIRARINAASFFVARSTGEEVRGILRSHEKGRRAEPERPRLRPRAGLRRKAGGEASVAREGAGPRGAELCFVGRDAMVGFAAKVSGDGSYVAAGMPPGRYDAVMRAGGEILAGFPVQDDPRIDPATRARVERAIDAAREFFDEKSILRLWGDRERVRAFVELRRAVRRRSRAPADRCGSGAGRSGRSIRRRTRCGSPGASISSANSSRAPRDSPPCGARSRRRWRDRGRGSETSFAPPAERGEGDGR